MEATTRRNVTLIIASIAALGGLVSVLAYFENKRDKELKREVLEIDKNIKLLDLHSKLNRVSANT